jgi:hypothetical protein
MFNYIFKLFSGIFSWFREIRPKRIRSYIIPCYFIAVFAIVLQCLIVSPLTVKGDEISKFGGNRLNFRNGLTESEEYTLLPILSNWIQAFQFSQYLVSEFYGGFCHSVFSVDTKSNIPSESNSQDASSDSDKVIYNKLNHRFIWFCVCIVIWFMFVLSFTQQ